MTEARPFPDAGDLLRDLARAGIRVAVVTSGQAEHVEHVLQVIGAGSAVTAVVSAEDVEPKRERDLIARAVAAVSASYA